MKKDLIISIVIHLVFFIILALGNLFFYKKIELQQINVSLVTTSGVLHPSYEPLQLNKEDLQIEKSKNSALSMDLKVSTTKGENSKNKENLEELNHKKLPMIVTKKETQKPAEKDNIVNKNKDLKALNNLDSHSDEIYSKQKEKNLFANSIISGLNKEMLSQQEIQALNDQIKGCWYAQGGYSEEEDLKVELLLTMNPDATIKNIEVLKEETYNTPLRKALLEQVLRALNDPKCKYLKLPLSSFSNWRIIHIVFNPKG